MIDLLVDAAWKSALICGVALIACQAMRARAAAERVLLLRAALAMMLLLPLAGWLLPSLDLEIAVVTAVDAEPVAGATLAYNDAAAALEVPAAAPGIEPMILLYAAGAVLVLLRLAVGLATLWRWTRSAAPVSDAGWSETIARAAAALRRPAKLMVSPRVAAPISWGVAPAWVLIHPDLERQPEQAEAVIAHEMAHIRRFDWPVLMLSQLAIALFWFNPLVWLLDRALTRETELAADDEAVMRVAQADYAQALLSVAGASDRYAACSMTVPNRALVQRISRLLDGGARRPASRLFCIALLVAAPAAAAPLAALRIVPADPALPAETMPAAKAPAATRDDMISRPEVALARPMPEKPLRAAVAGRRVPPRRAAAATMPPAAAPSEAPAAQAQNPANAARRTPPTQERLDQIVAERIARLVPPRPAPSSAPPAGLRQKTELPDPEIDRARANSEPQGVSRLQRLRRWIARLRDEAGRLDRAATYYPDSSDVRVAYVKAAGDARRQADMLERSMRKLTAGQ